MPPTLAPSLTSRTSPTKLAMAPTAAPTSARPAASASSSALTSKSPAWMRTPMLAPGHWRKEGHFVAGLEQRRRHRHVLVHGRAQGPAGLERLAPSVAARSQLGAQRLQRGARLQFHLFARA